MNGQSGDSFIGNNTAIFPVTRVACSTNTTNGDIIELEEPTIKIYTITGMLLDINKIEYLSSGIYIIHYEYSDHVDIEKIIK